MSNFTKENFHNQFQSAANLYVTYMIPINFHNCFHETELRWFKCSVFGTCSRTLLKRKLDIKNTLIISTYSTIKNFIYN